MLLSSRATGGYTSDTGDTDVAKKTTLPQAELDQLVNQKLVTVATSDGFHRLSGAGEYPALFGKTGQEKSAAQACVTGDPPLLSVEGSARKAFVQLTPAGFLRITGQLPDATVGAVAKAVAERIPSMSERVEFVETVFGRTPLAAAELVPVLKEAQAAAQAEAEARLAAAEKRRVLEEASLKAAEQWKHLIADRRKDRIAALLRELEIEGAKAEAPAPAAPPRPAAKSEPTKPATPADHGFRRDAADQLTSAWRAAWDDGKADAREYLESAIWNISGFRTIGEVGQRVPFDGRLHECRTGVSTGESVRVVRPGWLVEDEHNREYIPLKALVEN
jgi:hypothetical protein